MVARRLAVTRPWCPLWHSRRAGGEWRYLVERRGPVAMVLDHILDLVQVGAPVEVSDSFEALVR